MKKNYLHIILFLWSGLLSASAPLSIKANPSNSSFEEPVPNSFREGVRGMSVTTVKAFNDTTKTKKVDPKHLETFEDLFYGLRLDYSGTYFDLGQGSCGVIRFKSIDTKTVIIPSGGTYAKYNYPFTNHGFTAGNNGRLGAPEWHIPNSIEMEEGAELFEILIDGSEILRGRIIDINGSKTFKKVSN